MSSGSGAMVPRSGWMMTVTIGTTKRMFAPLHRVCTGISRKVQTKKTTLTEKILVLERYVQIRIVICTSFRERRACLQGRVSQLRMPVKSVVVQTCWSSRRISAEYRNRLHLRVLMGAKLGAKVCKWVQMCKRPSRSTPRTTSPSRSQRVSPSPRLRSAADVVGETRRWSIPLLRLPEEGEAAGEGAAAPGSARPPDV